MSPKTPSILHETDDFVAVEKPEGMPSIPEGPGKTNDVLTWVKNYLNSRPFVLHRLDKGVTGVILIGKNEAAS